LIVSWCGRLLSLHNFHKTLASGQKIKIAFANPFSQNTTYRSSNKHETDISPTLIKRESTRKVYLFMRNFMENIWSQNFHPQNSCHLFEKEKAHLPHRRWKRTFAQGSAFSRSRVRQLKMTLSQLSNVPSCLHQGCSFAPSLFFPKLTSL